MAQYTNYFDTTIITKKWILQSETRCCECAELTIISNTNILDIRSDHTYYEQTENGIINGKWRMVIENNDCTILFFDDEKLVKKMGVSLGFDKNLELFYPNKRCTYFKKYIIYSN
jgi:hypothetical protein